MNKKSYLRVIVYMILGVVVGAILARLMDTYLHGNIANISNLIEATFAMYLNELQIVFLAFMFIPTIVCYVKGSKLLKLSTDIDDDKFDEIEIKARRLMDMTLTINMTYMFSNFIMIGISFNEKIEIKEMIIGLLIFIFSLVSIVIIEFKSVRVIQNSDSRLKGDPSRLSFQKDYLESCDEAEKFRIYKSTYKSFQITKIVAFLSLVIATMGNMMLDTGILAIVLTAMISLTLILSYSADAMVKKL